MKEFMCKSLLPNVKNKHVSLGVATFKLFEFKSLLLAEGLVLADTSTNGQYFYYVFPNFCFINCRQYSRWQLATPTSSRGITRGGGGGWVSCCLVPCRVSRRREVLRGLNSFLFLFFENGGIFFRK